MLAGSFHSRKAGSQGFPRVGRWQSRFPPRPRTMGVLEMRWPGLQRSFPYVAEPRGQRRACQSAGEGVGDCRIRIQRPHAKNPHGGLDRPSTSCLTAQERTWSPAQGTGHERSGLNTRALPLYELRVRKRSAFRARWETGQVAIRPGSC